MDHGAGRAALTPLNADRILILGAVGRDFHVLYRDDPVVVLAFTALWGRAASHEDGTPQFALRQRAVFTDLPPGSGLAPFCGMDRPRDRKEEVS